MTPNCKLKFSWIFMGLLLLASCADDLVESTDPPVYQDEFTLVDTLFGNLTDKQQYFQHFIFEIPSAYQQDVDSIANWVIENEPGGLHFLDWDLDSISNLKLRLDTLDIIKPLYYANYFDYLALPEYPYWDASESNRDLKWTQVFANDRMGIIDFKSKLAKTPEFNAWLTDWETESGANFVTDHFHDKNVKKDFDSFQSALKISKNFVAIELAHFDTVALEPFRRGTQFEGMFIVTAPVESINKQLEGGADFLMLSLDENTLNQLPYNALKLGEKGQGTYQKSTKRILSLKQNLIEKPIKKGIAEQTKSVQLNLLYGSNTLLKNESKGLPLADGGTIYAMDKISLKSKLRSENKLRIKQTDLNKKVTKIIAEKGVKIVLVNDSVNADTKQILNTLTAEQNTYVCFSNPNDYVLLNETANLIYYGKGITSEFDYAQLMQQFTGQLAFKGRFSNVDSLVDGIQTKKLKLARTQPEFVGLSSDTLRKIDWAVQGALSGRAFPGCQVIIAKEGCIIYDKSFGYHTYDRLKAVTANSLYDLASLTKVVSTTMVGMKLYELGGYSLLDSLGDYISDTLQKHLRYPNTIKNLTFQELFIHKSGMPSGFPIIKYMQYTNPEIRRFDKYYCDVPDSVYAIEVAENFYLELAYQDSLWMKLNQIWLDKSKSYKYSDVNMNTLYFMFKSIIQSSPRDYGYTLKKDELLTRNLYKEFLYDKFYVALGMDRTKYKPLRHFSKNEIVPTEKENFWRKQLLHGHVHDPNAALYGGIAGNAGIFSTANDLAILGEMLLQKGTYNNKQYLKAETIAKFTNVQPNSHRGLGWNKPSLNTSAFGCADDASPQTYGHTGFTGTCIWIDPVNKLTYVFLSNRVHPSVNNRIYQYGIRGRVHQFAYEAQLFN